MAERAGRVLAGGEWMVDNKPKAFLLEMGEVIPPGFYGWVDEMTEIGLGYKPEGASAADFKCLFLSQSANVGEGGQWMMVFTKDIKHSDWAWHLQGLEITREPVMGALSVAEVEGEIVLTTTQTTSDMGSGGRDWLEGYKTQLERMGIGLFV